MQLGGDREERWGSLALVNAPGIATVTHEAKYNCVQCNFHCGKILPVCYMLQSLECLVKTA